MTVHALMEALGYESLEARFLTVLRNGDRLLPQDVVGPGDAITIMLMIGGG